MEVYIYIVVITSLLVVALYDVATICARTVHNIIYVWILLKTPDIIE